VRPVEFSPKANSDPENIGDYIARDNPGRALSFVLELKDRCKNLGDFPESHPEFPALGDNARFMTHGNYVVLYNVLSDRVRIESVLHGARDILALISGDD
jgi:plasmid stabilization system protein ParE